MKELKGRTVVIRPSVALKGFIPSNGGLGRQGKQRFLPRRTTGREQQTSVPDIVVGLLGVLKSDKVLPQKNGSYHLGSDFGFR